MPNPGERVRNVHFSADSIRVELEDGREISAPLAFYPRLLKATAGQLANWQISAGGQDRPLR